MQIERKRYNSLLGETTNFQKEKYINNMYS